MKKKNRISRELYEKLKAYAMETGVTVEDAVKLLIQQFHEMIKAEEEGKEVIFLYDYGHQGFIVSMPEDLPRRDPKGENVKVVKIKMPEYASMPKNAK